jgi:pimeloyl-ACP methyl ester carboxylesterase
MLSASGTLAAPAGVAGQQPATAVSADDEASAFATVADSVRLHYRRRGSGDPVLLVHGWPETSYAWRKVAPLLASSWMTIAPDLRGVGYSDRPASGYDKRTLATDLHALTASLGLGPVHLVAQDMGALVGVLFAKLWPNAVRSFTFIESAVPGFGLEAAMDVAHGGSWHFGFCMAGAISEELVRGRERMFLEYFYQRGTAQVDALTPHDVDEYVRTYASGGLVHSFSMYRTLLDDAQLTRELFAGSKLAVPVASIAAAHGLGELSHHSIERVAELSRRVTIDDAKHFLAQDQPHRLAETLTEIFRTT